MNAQEEAEAILREITEATGECVGRKYAKSVGAVTTQVIGQHLRDHGFAVSERDVFIRGLSLEIDLLLAKPDARPAHGIIYDPGDVLAALEIKRSGAYNKNTVPHMKEACQNINRHVGVKVPCAYVTLQEKKGYKHHPKDCDDFRVFCLFWYTGSRDKDNPAVSRDEHNPTVSEDWGNLLAWLRGIQQPVPAAEKLSPLVTKIAKVAEGGCP